MTNRKYKWWEWPLALITAGAIVYFANVLAQKSHFGWIEQPEKFFTFVLSAFTFLLLVAAIIVYRDRAAIREEVKEEKERLINLRKDLEGAEKGARLVSDSLNEKVGIAERYIGKIEEIKKQVEGKAKVTMEYLASVEKPPSRAATEPPKERGAVEVLNEGVVLLREGKTEGALNKFKEAMKLNPNYAEPHFQIGFTLGRQGDHAKAEYEFRRCIELDPNYASAHLNLGLALWKRGLFKDAEAPFTEAIRINPNFSVALMNLGGLLDKLNKRKEARGYWERAEKYEKNPEWAEIIKKRLAEPD